AALPPRPPPQAAGPAGRRRPQRPRPAARPPAPGRGARLPGPRPPAAPPALTAEVWPGPTWGGPGRGGPPTATRWSPNRRRCRGEPVRTDLTKAALVRRRFARRPEEVAGARG